MEIKRFNDLIEMVDDWTEGFAEEPLIIEEDLSTLTSVQWDTLRKSIKTKKAACLDICHGDTTNYSQDTWDALSITLKESNIPALIISKDSINQFNSAKWKALFSGIKTASLKSLGFRLTLYDMTFQNWADLLQGLPALAIEELNLEGHVFSDTSKELCDLFFDTILICQNIKRFLLGNDGSLGVDGKEFWKSCSAKISKTSIVHLGLDDVGIKRIPKETWLDLCQGLKGSSVTSLSLCDNNFYRFTDEQWKWFFQGLALTSVNELNLHEHHSLELKDKKWEVFCNGLRETKITKLHYYKSQFDENQKKTIEEILQENQKKISSSISPKEQKQSLENKPSGEEEEKIVQEAKYQSKPPFLPSNGKSSSSPSTTQPTVDVKVDPLGKKPRKNS